jgi:hypothetical protein
VRACGLDICPVRRNLKYAPALLKTIVKPILKFLLNESADADVTGSGQSSVAANDELLDAYSSAVVGVAIA